MFTSEEKQIIKIIRDPVLWMEYTLGEYARPHQVEMLRDKSIRKVLRLGRRSGKTFTMCGHMLWYAYTHNDAALIVVCPYENQVALIFDQLRRFIAKSPEISSSVTINRRNPQEVQFRNGSYIKGFTAGTKSGNAGASIRGQRADFLYLDEMDYMTDADFDAVYAIVLEAPKRIGVWAASTPTGRRGTFYRLCTEKDGGWREFHYPSMVNPEWDESMEKELRVMFSTQAAWEHEVLAEFGEETVGVFRKEYIDRAKQIYNYQQAAYTPAYRTIGVDWDKYQDATQIVVLEFDESLKKFKIVTREEVEQSEFTLTNAVNRIISLNERFNPNFIYVDRGFGEYQVETLHLYGSEHPESGLKEKVKGYQFAQHYDIMDPITKEMKRTPLKPFMVNQLVYLFERDLIVINEDDEYVWKQLENYRVEKYSASGQPVYTDEDEHSVDALMLANLAFTIELPHIANIVKGVQVARTFSSASISIPDPVKKLLKPFSTAGRRRLPNGIKEWDEPGPPPPVIVPLGTGFKKKGSAAEWQRGGTSSRRIMGRNKW